MRRPSAERCVWALVQFIETPEFNPEATRYQIVPGDFEMDLPETSRIRNAKNTQTIT